jgi:two-component system sensor histidine kinase KdpD
VGLAGLGLVLLTLVLNRYGSQLSLASIVLLYLVVVVGCAVLGGLEISVATAVVSDIVVNYYFVEPKHTFAVDSQDNVITLVVYVLVAIAVSLAMDLAARQRSAAVRSGIEAELLARVGTAPVREGSVDALLDHVRSALHMDSAALVEDSRSGPPAVVAQSGLDLDGSPTLSLPAGERLTLVVRGPTTFAPDVRFVRQLALATGRALQAERLAVQAARARELAEIDRVRSALLAAVGHDLRTPLAAIKAGASSLRDPELALDPGQQGELLATIDESADRMADLVENLLALSRLQAGALSVHSRPVAIDQVVAAALLGLHAGERVTVDVPDDLPLACADAGLLERAVANLLANALRASPVGTGPTVVGRQAGDHLTLSIVDRGPGVAPADRERIFLPFQRLGDNTAAGGLGLGLAIARGFVEAMNGTLVPTETPGGGLTMTITIPPAP